MIYSNPSATSADPASPEPSEARRESCTCCGGRRQPDPTDEFIGMLKELGHLGMRLARRVVVAVEEADDQVAVSPEATPEAPAAAVERDAADLAAAKLLAERRAAWQTAALAHQRLTRSIRQCMALAVKFHTDRLEREKQIEATENAAKRERRKRLKGQLDNLVGKTIERQFEVEKERLIESEDEFFDEQVETEKEERLYEALSERLDDEDIEHDLDEISQGALYGRICQDLGVQPDWERWGKLFQAMDEGYLRTPGSPYAAPPAAPEPERPKPEEAEADEPKADEAKPDVPEVPPIRNIDRMRTPEYQRGEDERKARILSKYYNGL